MKKLHILTCQPDDTYFHWQSLVQLTNARNLGISDKFRLLVFTPPDREPKGINPEWKQLEEQFSEAKFFYYFDRANIMADIGRVGYVPLLRPYMLTRHFKEYPELQEDTIFYIDGDVLFPDSIEWLDKYIQDDINYLSDTKSYLNSDYFDSKVRDVRPDKLEDYKKIDVLGTLAENMGISREICEKNKDATGGAQSLLKNVDYKFWQDVYSGSVAIRSYLRKINQEYFPSENAGFQSWAADMWALIFNIWKRGRETATPKDFDFAWATDPISKISEVKIFHNAGITGNEMDYGKGMFPVFYKGKYANNDITPFTDLETLDKILQDPQAQKLCTTYYIKQILKAKA